MVERILITMDKTLLKEVDATAKKRGYSSRSEFLRAAARTLIISQKGAMKGKPREIDEEELVRKYLKKRGLKWKDL